jgi:hypothetical protein
MNELPAIPEEFTKVIKDFVTDIQTTFPEFCPLISKWWKSRKDFEYIESLEERETKFLEAQGKSIQLLHRFCTKKFPPRFFDLLYQNEEIFKEDAEHDTEFLPHIHFKTLWELDISQKTKDTIWKYLQLILFSIITNISDRDSFGDTAKLFEAINEDELKTKLEETFKNMQGMFTGDTKETGKSGENTKFDGVNMEEFEKFAEQFKNLTGETIQFSFHIIFLKLSHSRSKAESYFLINLFL